MESRSPLVLICYNTCRYAYLFRRPLMRRLKAEGYRVALAAPPDEYGPVLAREEGIAYYPLTAMRARGTNPLADLAAYAELRRLYGRLRPFCVLQYTIKPNIYGSMAAKALGIPAVNNVTGLGQAFVRDGAAQRVARALYRLAFKGAYRNFFQNADDLALFSRLGLCLPENARLLPGSGVDGDYYAPRPRAGDPRLSFLMAARLLKDKGVEDYAAAARILRGRGVRARFLLAGDHDPADPKMVDAADLAAWGRDGVVEWLGALPDAREAYAMADVVVLPTRYREGVPRSLLEGAAMAKPLIASDSVGAREPVEPGVNGWLVPPGRPEALAQAMAEALALPPERLAAMGQASRRIALERFAERVVLDAYLEALGGLRHMSGGRA